MGLEQEVAGSASGGEDYTFKRGVNVEYLSGREPKHFKILPAMPEVRNSPADWLPCRLSEEAGGGLTYWGKVIYMAQFIGHGMTIGERTNILAPQSFVGVNEAVFCPVSHAIQVAGRYREWTYLIKDETNGGAEKRKPLVKPSPMLVVNCINLDKPQEGVKLGLLKKTASDCLLSKTSGLAYQRPIQVSAQEMEEDYMAEWALGDFTDPNGGLSFTVSNNPDPKKFGYIVTLMRNAQQGTVPYPVSAELLANRYDLVHPETYLNKKDTWGIIQELIGVFNGISPSGQHEYEFLKLAFPEYADAIPNPPQGGGYSTTGIQVSVTGPGSPAEKAAAAAPAVAAYARPVPAATVAVTPQPAVTATTTPATAIPPATTAAPVASPAVTTAAPAVSALPAATVTAPVAVEGDPALHKAAPAAPVAGLVENPEWDKKGLQDKFKSYGKPA